MTWPAIVKVHPALAILGIKLLGAPIINLRAVTGILTLMVIVPVMQHVIVVIVLLGATRAAIFLHAVATLHVMLNVYAMLHVTDTQLLVNVIL